jgi:hypothetical protein
MGAGGEGKVRAETAREPAAPAAKQPSPVQHLLSCTGTCQYKPTHNPAVTHHSSHPLSKALFKLAH